MLPTLRVLIALLLPTAAFAEDRGPPPWGALTDTVQAAEIVLRDVCMPYIFERKAFEPLAEHERLVHTPRGVSAAGPNDKVWRIGSLDPVYAVAWADGTCSTYAGRGPAERLRSMAEAVILARPEGFAKGRESLEQDGRVLRTVYCAPAGTEVLVASITTPGPKSDRRTRALSSTVYRRAGLSPLCHPGPAA